VKGGKKEEIFPFPSDLGGIVIVTSTKGVVSLRSANCPQDGIGDGNRDKTGIPGLYSNAGSKGGSRDGADGPLEAVA
jgi:hypothetical protein